VKRSSPAPFCLETSQYEVGALADRADEALCQSVMTSSFGKPHPRDLDFLRTWQRKAKAADVFLIGQDHAVWEKGEDLVALQPRKDSDPFSEWLIGGFVYWFYRKIVFKVSSAEYSCTSQCPHSCHEDICMCRQHLSSSTGPRKSYAPHRKLSLAPRGLVRPSIRQ